MAGLKRARSNSKIVKRQKTSKRTVKKFRLKKNVRNVTNVSVGKGFPKKMTITHIYVDNVQMNVGAGTGVGSYIFSCNGIYDPNITSTGHQPLYYDQMAALYNHYHVIGSKITAKLTGNSTSSFAKPIRFVGFLNDDTVFPTSTNINLLMEQSLAKSKTVSGGNDRPVIMTLKWSAKKMFGSGILANNDLQGTVTTNPVEQTNFCFAALCSDDVSASDLWLEVRIEYITVWDELKEIASS